jgi:hypothetical protein
MSAKFEDYQKMGQDQFQAVNGAAMSVASNFQTMLNEAGAYSKSVFESSASYVEKMLGAKSLENAVQIQADYAKASYESLLAQTTKVGEIYATIAKSAMRPVESAFGKVQAAV